MRYSGIRFPVLRLLGAGLLLTTFWSTPAGAKTRGGPSNAACLECHADRSLRTDKGKRVGVNAAALRASVHAKLRCVSCHDQHGDYEDTPHYKRYRAVKCGKCHGDAVSKLKHSGHGRAPAGSAPTCADCHGKKDSHAILSLTHGVTERSCRSCHEKETERYRASVHFHKEQQGGPGCSTCHKVHTPAMPPSVGAVSKVCVSCHKDAMTQVQAGLHKNVKRAFESVTACASCHDVHATHKPQLDRKVLQACNKCHPKHKDKFRGSVHEELLKEGEMSCLSCHRSHQVTDAKEKENFGCGSCHEDAEKEYRRSVHRLARLKSGSTAATCGDCHNGHHVLPASDPKSPVSHNRVPKTCAKCHTNARKITSDYVRLPLSLPRYSASIHGAGWKEHKRGKNGKQTAVCTDCHGSHLLLSAADPDSSINKTRLSRTCGQCHSKVAREYEDSVHGRAVAHGIDDSPSCTDCHEEHLILPHTDPRSPAHRARLAHATCAKCHEDPEIAVKYGLQKSVVVGYEDSYHGWATKRGGRAAAVCIDCHTTHAIHSALDPKSATHKGNVVKTCGKCHENSNPKFAASYSHLTAHGKRMPHDWARLIYIWLLVLVLGGMVLHNMLIAAHDIRGHYRQHRRADAVKRMTRSDLLQHLLVLVTFVALAVSGFALRYPDSWWARLLEEIGFSEELRRNFHRSAAVALVAGALYHLIYMMLTRRGRRLTWLLLPRWCDVKDAMANVGYYLGWRKQRPTFAFFDYTQKAEYWALVWGTALMSLTGFVLWFPDVATMYLPPWAVRVAEVVHFYEAILAVSAIIVWHLFFVVFKTGTYPMSWIWVDGRMPRHEWEEHHGKAEARDVGEQEPSD